MEVPCVPAAPKPLKGRGRLGRADEIHLSVENQGKPLDFPCDTRGDTYQLYQVNQAIHVSHVREPIIFP